MAKLRVDTLEDVAGTVSLPVEALARLAKTYTATVGLSQIGTIDLSKYEYAWFPCRSEVGDDGGGYFYITDSGEMDGVLTFATGDGRVLHRFYGGAINVRWAGAKGDGITDDSIALRRALDSAKKSSVAKKLFFPEGEYLCSTLEVHGAVGYEVAAVLGQDRSQNSGEALVSYEFEAGAKLKFEGTPHASYPTYVIYVMGENIGQVGQAESFSFVEGTIDVYHQSVGAIFVRDTAAPHIKRSIFRGPSTLEFGTSTSSSVGLHFQCSKAGAEDGFVEGIICDDVMVRGFYKQYFLDKGDGTGSFLQNHFSRCYAHLDQTGAIGWHLTGGQSRGVHEHCGIWGNGPTITAGTGWLLDSTIGYGQQIQIQFIEPWMDLVGSTGIVMFSRTNDEHICFDMMGKNTLPAIANITDKIETISWSGYTVAPDTANLVVANVYSNYENRDVLVSCKFIIPLLSTGEVSELTLDICKRGTSEWIEVDSILIGENNPYSQVRLKAVVPAHWDYRWRNPQGSATPVDGSFSIVALS